MRMPRPEADLIIRYQDMSRYAHICHIGGDNNMPVFRKKIIKLDHS